MRQINDQSFRGVLLISSLLLQTAVANAQIVDTELVGNSLSQYPFFQYVKAINENATMEIAIDPTRFSGIGGETCDVYVVASKNTSQWTADNTLTDVTPGGAQMNTFSSTNIQANTFQVTAPYDLNSDAGMRLGVGYDVVLDCDEDGTLSDGDYIDGRTGEAGFYAVHDTTTAGPAAVTEDDYNLVESVAATFLISPTRVSQNLFYPTNIASMGKRPLVIIGHGNGHQYGWYDHIGRHLASYGYIVMSHDNATWDSEGGPSGAATTTLGHTDAFIDQAELGAIAGGALVGHLDTSQIVWIGHSRGAEGVAIAYDRLFDGSHVPTHYSKDDIKLISSMLPTDFRDPGEIANPHDANYHLWTASGDADVSGGAGNTCCQTFRLHDRATHYRQSTVVQGTGHGWFHNGTGGPAFSGECSIGEDNTHLIQLGYLLPLVKHYVDGNIPALDFLTRQYESFRPIGVPTDNACIVVTHEYRNGSTFGNAMIDDYQTQTGTGTGSAGGPVTFNVQHVTEGRLDDNNGNFSWVDTDPIIDPFNGATQGMSDDTTRGVVFDWTDEDRYYEWTVPAASRDFTNFLYLSFRGAQGTQHPNTLAVTGDLTFNVTLRDGTPSQTTSTINISAYGGGLEQPYDRNGGWHNEMETIRLRLTDFLHNGSGIDLMNIVAVRLNVGPSSGSSRGRIVVDELMLTSNVPPIPFEIIEPTSTRPSYAGTSVAGSRILVRIRAGGDRDVSPANLSIAVDGITLTPAQIPTAATTIGGETWIVVAPGPKADGCYDLSVSLIAPPVMSDLEASSLCYADDESRELDRVLVIDQTNSMNRDGSTGVESTEKMDAARAAARFFVDLSNPNDQVGIVSFQRRDEDDNGSITEPDELADVKFPLTLAGEDSTDQRPAARSAIAAIQPDASPGFFGPETSPGAALVEARTMLNNDGMPGHEPNIILLTDGLENYAPFWATSGPHGSPLRPSFEGDTIRIDTIGIGGDADDALLDDIAVATGGEFRNLNEGSGSFFLLSRLSSWYKAIDEDIRGEQRFFYREGFPPATYGDVGHFTYGRGKLRVGQFTVEPALDWMTVAFHANFDNAALVALIPPGGTAPITVSPPNVTYRADAKHAVYRIRTPQAGVWSYVVQANNLTAEFYAVASAATLLAARVGPNQLARLPGGDYSMPLRVWVADTDAVVNATVNGYIRRPDGVKIPITLLDNGSSMDGANNDGIYGLEYIATVPGSHYVDLKVAGISNASEPFERYLSTAFEMPGAHKKPIQFGEGLPPLIVTPCECLDGFCGCEAKARWTLAGYGGLTLPAGSFNSIADPSYSIGIKPAFHFSGFGARWSAGLYLGRDQFSNVGTGGDFTLTHLSPEIEVTPWADICPRPAIHAGAGAYRNEQGDTEFGYNVGASLGICLTRRVKLLTRYDYRSIDDFSRDYSTLQVGLRFNF